MTTESGSAGSKPSTEREVATWNILVIDDEKDVHEVTHLALKRRQWRKRPFELSSAFSAREALEILGKKPKNYFQVALVDVVMETQSAGLDICRHIRAEYPISLRIVLRTGQPGVAPEERIINDFDIDYYMAKPEVTPEKLFATVRSCLRSSQDIDTLLAFSRQLRNFTSALQTIATEEDLTVVMNEGLRFLELKHQVHIEFVKSIEEPGASEIIKKAHAAKLETDKVISGSAIGFGGYVLLFAVRVEGTDQVVCGGFSVELAQGALQPTLQSDLELFMQNWTIAHGALLLQQRVQREKMLNERMYIERIEGIANMVTGVAHEINTPLGVASTANGMISSLAADVAHTPPGPKLDEILGDLKESTELLTKNLERASKLVRNFKQLSASQLCDERASLDLTSIILDCVGAMSVETKKRKVTVRSEWSKDRAYPWIGFPGHLSQVLVNLIQNTLRYAYRGEDSGVIDIRLVEEKGNYVLTFQDYGVGVDPDILPRMFEPFVTSGRSTGGTGLGLAISQNIMTNLLKGKISCTTEPGKGTKFTLVLPTVVPH
jgi:signal transduction histidine kinase/DNA-binding response OmpR family regulator